jgi:hypothetical protein
MAWVILSIDAVRQGLGWDIAPIPPLARREKQDRTTLDARLHLQPRMPAGMGIGL